MVPTIETMDRREELSNRILNIRSSMLKVLGGGRHEKDMRLSVSGNSDPGNLAAVIDAAGSQAFPSGSLRWECDEIDHFSLVIEKAARATGPDDLAYFIDGKGCTLLTL